MLQGLGGWTQGSATSPLNELFAKGEGEILLYPLPNYLDLVSRKVLEGQADEVAVVPPEVVEKHREYAGSSQADVAPPICSTTIHPRHMVVISHILFGAVEGFLPDLAGIIGLESAFHEVFVLEALLQESLIVELHGLVRDLQQLLQEPIDAPLPHIVLEPPLELWEGGDDCVPDGERRLTLVFKGLVAEHGLLVSGLSHHRIDVAVDH